MCKDSCTHLTKWGGWPRLGSILRSSASSDLSQRPPQSFSQVGEIDNTSRTGLECGSPRGLWNNPSFCLGSTSWPRGRTPQRRIDVEMPSEPPGFQTTSGQPAAHTCRLFSPTSGSVPISVCMAAMAGSVKLFSTSTSPLQLDQTVRFLLYCPEVSVSLRSVHQSGYTPNASN